MTEALETPTLQAVKVKQKVAIVGGAQTWVDAPFDDKEWEIWGLGNQISQYDGKRIDLVFEIHNDFSNRPEGYSSWLVAMKHPMVVGDGFGIEGDLIEVFDFAKAREMMGGDFLTSTPAYQLAYALYSRPDVKEIGLWGVDMAVDDDEYFHQQPIINRWIGYCQAKGIKITFPEGCPLGEPSYMEGVTANHPEPKHPFSEGDFKDLAAKHKKLMAECDEKAEVLKLRKAQHNGAMQIYDKLAQVGRATDAGQEFGSLLQTLRTLE